MLQSGGRAASGHPCGFQTPSSGLPAPPGDSFRRQPVPGQVALPSAALSDFGETQRPSLVPSAPFCLWVLEGEDMAVAPNSLGFTLWQIRSMESFGVGNTVIWSYLVHSPAPLSSCLRNRGDRAVLTGQLLLNKDV